MSYYYDAKNITTSNPHEYKINISGYDFVFKTDNGVFSKKYIDFGSRLLIENFALPSIEGKILDLGAGYGVMGIVLAKIHLTEITLIDINDRAIKLCEENTIINQVKTRIILNDSINQDTYAAILTNPPIRAGKKVVYQFFLDAYNHLLKKGEFWVVIRKEQGAMSAQNELNKIFGNCLVVERKKGFYIFKCIKSID